MQVTVFILKHADRPPFARQDQVGITIPVQVAPNRSVHQPRLLQDPAVFLVQHQLPFHVPVNPRIRRLRIPPRDHPPTHKQVQRAVPINIRHGQRPGAGRRCRQVLVLRRRNITEHRCRSRAAREFVIVTSHRKRPPMRARNPSHNPRQVFR